LLPPEDELPDLPLAELRPARARLVPPDEPLRLRLLFALLLPLERFDADLLLPLDRFAAELPRRVACDDRLRAELADLRPVCRER